MPFTIAHTAAVLPVRRFKFIDVTAFILGTMAPDFEYFIHFKPYQLHGHTWFGLLYFNLPLVMLLAVIYHRYLREAVVVHLPSPYDESKSLYKKVDFNFRYIISFVISALMGMISHIIWDSFTHLDGYFVSRLSLLNYNLGYPIYKYLQHGSTVFGFIVIIIFLHSHKKNYAISIKSTNEKVRFWCESSIFSFVAYGIFFLLLDDKSLGRHIVMVMNACFLGLLISSIKVKVQSKV